MRKAARELGELSRADRHSPLEGADAYRALVLLARLRDAPPAAPAPGDVLTVDVAGLLQRCARPDLDEILTSLASALEGAEEPGGPLLDALLDIDDLAGVLGHAGEEAARERLVAEALALVARRPERVAPLAGWAEMRRAALAPGAVITPLWEAILGAVLAPSSGRAQSALTQAHERALALQIPELPRVAAHTVMADDLAVHDASGQQIAVAYVDPQTGERLLDITLPSRDTPDPASIRLFALRRDTREPLGSEPLSFEREGRDVYVSLGQDVGPESARHRLAARLGVDVGDVIFEVRLREER
ncbi:hypothetical protein WMF04_46580 [Sorangium sp. So ce260]|uniref:hypothetical protein n=1 Tax=Sorangium sp. So ce260 TaxID=3133291 RepID=UPI003F640577